MTNNDLAASIQSALRRLTWATVGLYAVVILLLVAGFAVSQRKSEDLRRESQRTTGALCTFRRDLESRVEQTNAYLRTHPKGFAGISAATLRQSLQNQAQTVRALQSLKCPPPLRQPFAP